MRLQGLYMKTLGLTDKEISQRTELMRDLLKEANHIGLSGREARRWVLRRYNARIERRLV